MQLSESDILQYQQLVKEHTGQEITFEQAAQCGQSLVRLVQMVYKPITKEKFNQYHKPVE